MTTPSLNPIFFLFFVSDLKVRLAVFESEVHVWRGETERRLAMTREDLYNIKQQRYLVNRHKGVTANDLPIENTAQHSNGTSEM